MTAAMDKTFEKHWASRKGDCPVGNRNEVITLASIVEKETGKPSERRMVAGVYCNRLKIGMKLDADPTVIYPVTKGKPLGRRILDVSLLPAIAIGLALIFGAVLMILSSPLIGGFSLTLPITAYRALVEGSVGSLNSIVATLVNATPLVLAWTATLAGFQLLSLGILGEYLGRLYEQSKGRPLFMIERVERGGATAERRDPSMAA